jgi:phage/plasmid primase-like uncharacterized protein
MTAPADTQMNRARAEWVERARTVDICEIIVRRGIKLRGRGQQFAGACPRCGGRDRFAIHTGKDAFLCRGCGGRGRGAISLVMFLDGSQFLEAVATIIGEPPPDGERAHNPDRARREQVERERHAADRERRDLEQATRKPPNAQRLLRCGRVVDRLSRAPRRRSICASAAMLVRSQRRWAICRGSESIPPP